MTQILRQTGVVGKFVEYFGAGVSNLPLADRATIGNMSPEYGATCGFFPVDQITLEYLPHRTPGGRIALVEAYCKENLLWHDPDHEPTYTQVVELDLGDVEPSLAGPRRPQDRVPLTDAKRSFLAALETFGVDYGTSSTSSSPSRSPRATRPPTARRATIRSSLQADPVAGDVLAPSAKAVPVEWTASGSTSSTEPS